MSRLGPSHKVAFTRAEIEAVYAAKLAASRAAHAAKWKAIAEKHPKRFEALTESEKIAFKIRGGFASRQSWTTNGQETKPTTGCNLIKISMGELLDAIGDDDRFCASGLEGRMQAGRGLASIKAALADGVALGVLTVDTSGRYPRYSRK